MFEAIKSLFSSAPSVDLSELISQGALLVDVRTPAEFAEGNVKGSVNIPLDQVERRISEFKKKPNVIVFCRSGNRSGQAMNILRQHGINAVNGGTWTAVRQLINN